MDITRRSFKLSLWRNTLKNLMRVVLFSGLFLTVLFTSACEEKLKEHPLPESLKQKIIKQNDPALKLKEISGTISVADDYANSIPKNAKLFVIARYF